MVPRVAATALTIGGLLLPAGGCARYRARPLDPGIHAAAHRARRMDNAELRAWVNRYAGPLRDGGWTDRQLGIAALAQRADLERARREWLAARASAAAAGARPPPGVEGGVEHAVGGRDEGSPWVVSLAGLFTLELGGKRAARLQAARAREAAAEAELALLVAGTLGQVREAALAVRHAEASQDQAVSEVAALRRIEELERDRFAEAALGSADVARTASEVMTASAQAATRESEVLRARAALAAALAVSPDQVRALPLEPEAQAGCAWGSAVGADSLATLALVRRGEVAAALAGYAGAEADVRARMAAQYPDLELGPG